MRTRIPAASRLLQLDVELAAAVGAASNTAASRHAQRLNQRAAGSDQEQVVAI